MRMFDIQFKLFNCVTLSFAQLVHFNAIWNYNTPELHNCMANYPIEFVEFIEPNGIM